jgi:hypothetical protein
MCFMKELNVGTYDQCSELRIHNLSVLWNICILFVMMSNLGYLFLIDINF